MPGLAVSVCPTCAVPVIVGRLRFTGAVVDVGVVVVVVVVGGGVVVDPPVRIMAVVGWRVTVVTLVPLGVW